MNISRYFQRLGRALIGADDVVVQEAPSTSSSQRALKYVKSLGGHGNITSIDACITRLRLKVNDIGIVDEAQLKRLGAKGVVKTGKNDVQIVLGPIAETVAQEMKQVPASQDLTQVQLP